MRNPNRIDPTIEALRAEWKKHPDWRLAQLLHNLISSQDERLHAKDQFHAEDDLVMKALGMRMLGLWSEANTNRKGAL